MKAWEYEYRRRLLDCLGIPRTHIAHGFVDVAVIEWRGEDETTDPTWGETISARMELIVRGECPCGEKLYVSEEGPSEIASTIRFITDPEYDDQLMTGRPEPRKRDPFRRLPSVARAAEEIEDAIDEIAHRYGVTVIDDNECGGIIVVDDKHNEATVIT